MKPIAYKRTILLLKPPHCSSGDEKRSQIIKPTSIKEGPVDDQFLLIDSIAPKMDATMVAVKMV